MELTSALLVLIIILLVVALFLRPTAPAGADGTDTWDCVNRNTGDISSVAINKVRASKPGSPEAAATKETVEHFQGCDNGLKTADVDAECSNAGDMSYAVNEYGAPGMSYKDWVAAQAIDPAVVQNHAEYVKDRAGSDWSQSATGRTWAFPDHESYEPTTWSGIRGRPQRVAVCNPTEVLDDDISWYPAKQRLRW